ncbi:hypothetical protein AAMO2058_000167300 [Amorphochlora amoebiformis]
MSAIGRAARRATGCAQRARCSISTRSMLKGHDNPPVFDTKVGYSSTVVGSLCAGIFLGGCATVKFAVWWAQKKAGKLAQAMIQFLILINVNWALMCKVILVFPNDEHETSFGF